MVNDRIDQSSGETVPPSDQMDLIAPQIPHITSPSDMLLRQEKERRKPLVRLITVLILIMAILLIPAGLIPALDPVTLISLNLLLDRLGRLTRDQETQVRVNRAAHELAQGLQRVRQGFSYTPPAYTGTPFDEVLVELAYLRTSRSPVNSRSRLAGYRQRPDSRSTAGLTEDSGGFPGQKATNLIDHEFDWPAWLRNQCEAGDMQSPPD